MVTEVRQILEILERYISPYNARGLLSRALTTNGLKAETLTRAELRLCSAALKRGINLFAEPAKRAEAMREIGRLCEGDSIPPEACIMELKSEADISRVRAEARRICEAIGADVFTAQKVATIVSELARNAILYANGGTVEIVPLDDGQKRIVIRAFDNGPGIKNLDEIMSGRYRSKTGLGRGLLGTKRLASHFDVKTGPSGTRVSAEIAL